jgi:hypothetical protein
VSTSSAGGQAGQFGANEWLVEEMYQRFLDDPAALDLVWRDFFADYQPADTGGDVTVGPAGAGVPVGPAGGAIVVSGPAEAVEAPKAGATTGPEAGGRTVADAAGPAPSRPTSKKPVEGSTSRPARPAVTTGQGRRSRCAARRRPFHSGGSSSLIGALSIACLGVRGCRRSRPGRAHRVRRRPAGSSTPRRPFRPERDQLPTDAVPVPEVTSATVIEPSPPSTG